MMKSIGLILLFITTTEVFAARVSVSMGDNSLRFEPIVGYETTYRDSPTPHTVNRMVYGARLVYGERILAGELEYTQGSDTENFSVAPQKIQTKSEKAKLGIRSTIMLSDFFSATGRLGAQASRGTQEKTSDGVITKTDIPLKVYPYAGASLGIHLADFVTVSAGTTVVFRDNQNMLKNDIQNYISLSIGIN